MANNVNGGSSKALANDLTEKRSLRHREDELQSLRLFPMDLVPVGFFAGFIVLLMVLLICLFVPPQLAEGRANSRRRSQSSTALVLCWLVCEKNWIKVEWLNIDLGRHQGRLDWAARQKIAVGAARGLRYLHEECRVGCIVHRDVRPNNILITHDFEPLVGDFGLARWQPDGDKGEATRVIGTFGYLAPEYAESGEVTEKADVYSFGVVLLELVSGRKAVDINRPKGQQCLTEWARLLLEENAVHKLIDPRLGNCYSEHEVCCMLEAACLCIKRDPHLRPRMSQVLRMLEGDVMMESIHM